MKTILMILSYLGLALTVFPSFFLVGGSLSPEACKTLMAAGTVFWFATAVFWVGKNKVSL